MLDESQPPLMTRFRPHIPIIVQTGVLAIIMVICSSILSWKLNGLRPPAAAKDYCGLRRGSLVTIESLKAPVTILQESKKQINGEKVLVNYEVVSVDHSEQVLNLVHVSKDVTVTIPFHSIGYVLDVPFMVLRPSQIESK